MVYLSLGHFAYREGSPFAEHMVTPCVGCSVPRPVAIDSAAGVLCHPQSHTAVMGGHDARASKGAWAAVVQRGGRMVRMAGAVRTALGKFRILLLPTLVAPSVADVGQSAVASVRQSTFDDASATKGYPTRLGGGRSHEIPDGWVVPVLPGEK